MPTTQGRSRLRSVSLTGRALPLGGVLALCLLAWAYLLFEAAGMADMSDRGTMAAMTGTATVATPWTGTELGYLGLMWSVMMVAMMLPSAAPTILLVARLGRERRARAEATGGAGTWDAMTPTFVAGYMLAWVVYSLVAATVQWTLHGTLLVSDTMVSASPWLSGGLLLVAGLFQFTPLKERCVSHCRSPLAFVTRHWHEGAGGALRMGLHHGTYCVGCCWALMALLFVLGVMNLMWVTALAVLVLLEKTLPAGRWVTRVGGAALVVWALVVLVRAAGVGGT